MCTSVLIPGTFTPQGFMQVLCRTMGAEIVGVWSVDFPFSRTKIVCTSANSRSERKVSLAPEFAAPNPGKSNSINLAAPLTSQISLDIFTSISTRRMRGKLFCNNCVDSFCGGLGKRICTGGNSSNAIVWIIY